MPRLTKRVVDAATPRERDVFLWDSTLPGFGLRVFPSGRKSYLIQYRAKGHTRRLSIGAHGVLTPDAARTQAMQLLAEVQSGRDPSETRRAAMQEPTVADLAHRYWEEHAKPRNKPRTLEGYRPVLDGHILPKLGGLRVRDVTRADVAVLHHSLHRIPYQANRVLAVLSKMFNLAECWGLRPDGSNPCRHIQRFPEKRRERFLSEVELARLGEALREVESEGSELRSVVPAIRLLVLTGARKGEILGLLWEDVDLKGGCARLRDSKTGPRILPLNAPALTILDGLPRDSCWVLPGKQGDGILRGLTRAWHRIRARAEIHDVRLHDLRHSFASVGAGAGASLHILGRLLGHTQPTTTHRYAHLSDDPVRQVSESIGERIAAAMGASTRAEVVDLQSERS